jgi:hypothetical protein
MLGIGRCKTMRCMAAKVAICYTDNLFATPKEAGHLTTVGATGVRKRMCAVFSEAHGEDPCGSAPFWQHCLVLELAPPWEHEVMDSRSFPRGIADILARRPDVRLQAIQPDDIYSVEGHSRVILFSRPDGPVSKMARREYLVPTNSVSAVVSALLGAKHNLDEFAEWRLDNEGMRDILVCTHGSRDICCASIGHPTYQELRAAYAAPDTRIWRQSHTGGHRLAPNVIDMPSARYWSRLTPTRARNVAIRSGDLSELQGAYRGWAALNGSGAQIAEREAFMREGWDWLERRVESELVETSDDGLQERVAIRSFDETGLVSEYEATVRQTGTVRSIECLTDEFAKEYPQYELVKFERVC